MEVKPSVSAPKLLATTATAIATAIANAAAHISDEVLALEFTQDPSLAAGENDLAINVVLVKA